MNDTRTGSGRLLAKKKDGVRKFLKDNYTGWLFNMPLTVGLLVFTLIPVG